MHCLDKRKLGRKEPETMEVVERLENNLYWLDSGERSQSLQPAGGKKEKHFNRSDWNCSRLHAGNSMYPSYIYI